METSIWIQEEFIMQNLVLLFFGFLLLCALFNELVQNIKEKRIDDLKLHKMKKIFKYAYLYVFDRDKEKTVKYMKEIQKKNLVDEKYKLLKGV